MQYKDTHACRCILVLMATFQVILVNKLILTSTITTTTVLRPFSRTIRLSWCQKKASSGLYGAREDNKRQAHQQSMWAPLHPD